MLRAGSRGLEVPFAENPQPPAEVTPTIGAWRTVMRADREIDAPARALQLIGNLHARRSRADHQHGALWQLRGVAIRAGMDLQDAGSGGNERRDDGNLERPGRGHDAVGFDHAIRSLDAKSRTADIPLHQLDLHAAADRRVDLLGVSDEIVGDLLLGRKAVGTRHGKLHARKPVMPGRAVGDEGVPALRTPALGDPAALENEMRHPAFAKMLAHGHPGLATADNERVYLLNRHIHVSSDGAFAAAMEVRFAFSDGLAERKL
ncbi:hypothetical protein MPLSOD_120258 [Mesorhizobium sp. SOD10]|nr:hypothetical protein MPLSOD_120258 [Mesorhizobium sp. SOD10]